MQAKTVKDILLYLIMPEDTTEACEETAILPEFFMKHSWLGPLKTIFWATVAVAAPLLLFAFRV